MVFALTKLRIIGELPKQTGCSSLQMRLLPLHSPSATNLRNSKLISLTACGKTRNLTGTDMMKARKGNFTLVCVVQHMVWFKSVHFGR